MFDQRLPILGELERAIMDVTWSRNSVTVREVVEALAATRAPAYTTVMTVMNRLVEKGVLRRKPEGQSYRYTATKSKKEFLERSSRQAVAKFVRYFGDVAIAQFIDVLDDVDPKKLAELRRQLREGAD
ncbi:MAG: BlaI/MecI/CopY family transcriptional regulator [Candidatus Kerfeldbacteria bacterium]|nr:BlaI/MecI/CopY family transcriptional regulator [Candidatus Kerfeldbacteria bacterium]